MLKNQEVFASLFDLCLEMCPKWFVQQNYSADRSLGIIAQITASGEE